MPTRLGVRYYAPFTHFAAWDAFRLLTCLAAVVAVVLVLLVARARRREDRRSAVLYLVSIAVALGVVMGDTLVGLGRPPVVWLQLLRALFVLIAYTANMFVPGEAKRGNWAQRQS